MASETSLHVIKRQGGLVLAAGLLLTALWSGSAAARTQSEADCDSVSRELEQLEAPSITAVDHGTALVESIELALPADFATAGKKLPAPLLVLEPRVSSALQGIFDDSLVLAPGSAKIDIAVSPLAETEETVETLDQVEEPSPDTRAEEESDLPLLQRQMYRIDI